MSSGNENIVEHFIRAKTPDQLKKRMFVRQKIDKMQYTFTDKNLQNDGYWYAWYKKEMDRKTAKVILDQLYKNKENEV